MTHSTTTPEHRSLTSIVFDWFLDCHQRLLHITVPNVLVSFFTSTLTMAGEKETTDSQKGDKKAAAPKPAGRGKGKTAGKKAISRSAKAGLQFPVGRIARFLKKGKYAGRIGA